MDKEKQAKKIIFNFFKSCEKEDLSVANVAVMIQTMVNMLNMTFGEQLQKVEQTKKITKRKKNGNKST